MYNLLLGIQWVLFVGGLVAAVPAYYFFSPIEALLTLNVGLLALANLKLDVVSLAK
jgi:hypothetical protein